MSVYKRSYKTYPGPFTTNSMRFLALMRYAFLDAWASRVTVVMFFLCLAPMLIMTAIIYVANNDAVRLLLGLQGIPTRFGINEEFFFGAAQIHCWPALLLTAWIGPRLIGLDMTNNALPIILSHPISRLQYVLAKLAVLAGMLSAIMWMPLMWLFLFQARMSPTPWASSHMHIAIAILLGSFTWITLISLIALATSSWVKWRVVATGMVIAAIFIPAGMGSVFNEVMRTNWGSVVNIPASMFTLWRRLMHLQLPRYVTDRELPSTAIVIAISLICGACILALNARIRAREVVRG